MEKNFGVASNQINVKNFCGMMEIHIALIQMGQFNVSSTIQLRDITNLKMITQCVVKNKIHIKVPCLPSLADSPRKMIINSLRKFINGTYSIDVKDGKTYWIRKDKKLSIWNMHTKTWIIGETKYLFTKMCIYYAHIENAKLPYECLEWMDSRNHVSCQHIQIYAKGIQKLSFI